MIVKRARSPNKYTFPSHNNSNIFKGEISYENNIWRLVETITNFYL